MAVARLALAAGVVPRYRRNYSHCVAVCLLKTSEPQRETIVISKVHKRYKYQA